MPYNKGTQAKKTMNEQLDLETLALLAQLEEDLGCPIDIFDEDEILDEIPA